MPLIEMDNHKTNERLDKIMAAIDDLKAAIATLQTTVTSVFVTALGGVGNNDAQVEVDVAAIVAANAALQSALAPGTVADIEVPAVPDEPVTEMATEPETAEPEEAAPVAPLLKPGDPGYRQTR